MALPTNGLIISLLVAVLPTALYALFFWWLDRYEKEPLRLLAAAFLWGAIPAIFLSLLLEMTLSLPLGIFQEQSAELIAASLIAPPVEEIAKALALLLLYLLFRREFDGPLDGIIYGALVGLGFAMTENVAYFMRSLGSGGWERWAATAIARTLFFGLNHAFFTALVGAALGYARLSRDRNQRWMLFLAGLGLAIAFHMFHNASLGLLETPIPALLSNWSGVLLIVVLAVWALRREYAWLKQELSEEVTLGALSAEDYAALTSFRRRGQSSDQHRKHGDLVKWKRLVQQATNLAFKKQQARRLGSSAEADQINALRRGVATLRAEMDGAQAVAPICPACGKIARPGGRFCAQCGRPLAMNTQKEG
jgi:RsiW-degrading membrane proteinase PrsW (M82 family)